MAKKKSFQISDSLSDGLEETITSAHSYSGEIRVDVIPLKKIEIDPENPRDLKISFNDLYNGLSHTDPHYDHKTKEILSLSSIANSIKEQGIINPIIVYKHGEKYRLVAGERRTLASILAGKGDILARILDSKPNELKISLLQWIENIERKDLTLSERLNNLEKIMQTYAESKKIAIDQVSSTELSQLLGCVKSHALNYKAVLQANKQVRHLIDENKIKNLEKAAFIANLKSNDIQHQAIEACLKGATLQKLKVTVEQTQQAQRTIKKIVSTRGRQAASVQLGGTKSIEVAKIIFDSVIKNTSINHLESHFQGLDWTDYKSATYHFKKLLQKLEEITG